MSSYLLRAAAPALVLVLLAGAPPAGAVPLPFLSTQASALGGGGAGFDGFDDFDVAAPPALLPIEGDALAVSSDGDMARAFASAAPGLLGTSTELSGARGGVFADATASFAGDVAASGSGVTLTIDFLSALMLDDFGAAGVTELVYTVFDGASVLVDESVLLDGVHDLVDTFVHVLGPASSGLLSLEAFLFSAAEAGPNGFVEGLASARFAFEQPVVAVTPEPAGALLLATGLVLVVRIRAGRNGARG